MIDLYFRIGYFFYKYEFFFDGNIKNIEMLIRCCARDSQCDDTITDSI